MDRHEHPNVRFAILLAVTICMTICVTVFVGCDSTRQATAEPAGAPQLEPIASDTAAVAGHFDRAGRIVERMPEDEPPFEQFGGHRP
jgi:hypothetical protein